MEESSRTGTERRPAWLPKEVDDATVDTYHIWAPRPIDRSILWKPIGEARRNAPAGAYEVFVEQRVLEAMYRHVWGAGHADEPFGYLFGDLCEDRESQRRYVVITRAVASTYPLFEADSRQISAEAARALRREEGRNGVVLAGWYHRHREGPVQLSEEDEATHREHFGEPWQVAFLFVTDPDRTEGGCFQPRTYGVTAHTPLPFYELAGVASLLAKGVRRTRVDWENVETDTRIVADAPPRPEVPREEPEPVAVEDESVAEAAVEAEFDSVEPEAVEPVFEPEDQESGDIDREPVEEPSEDVEVDLQPVSVVFHAPVSDIRCDLVATPEEQPLVLEDPPTTPEPEPAAESGLESVGETVAEVDLEVDSGDRRAPEAEAEAEVEAEVEAEPEPETAAVAVKAAIVSTAVVSPQLDSPAIGGPAIVSPTLDSPALDSPTPHHEVNHERRRKLVAVVEGVLAAAAIGAVVAGAWPLRYGNPTTTDQPGLATALAGFVMPARETVPALDESEASDPITMLGRGVRAAAGRYRTVAEMYVAGRLGCAPLREAHDEVAAGWTAFGDRLARVSDERSEGQVYFDGMVNAEALAVQADFTASGCEQP
jgi:proteasome lid subunit RPN8/RPN11